MSGSYSFLQIHDFLVKTKNLSNKYLEEIMSTLYGKGINYSYDSLKKESIRKGIKRPKQIPFTSYIDSFLVGKNQQKKVIEESSKDLF